MGSNILRNLALFFLLYLGSCFAEKPQIQKENQQNIPLKNEEHRRTLLSPINLPRLDEIPIVNEAATPGETQTPIINPTSSSQQTVPNSGGGSWCIASSSASPTALQVALDYACGYGGADCSAIQPGGSCYNPNTAKDHASYAFNDYYQKNPAATSCVFGGTAQLVSTDPSNGNCHYATPKAVPSPTPPAIPPPAPPAPEIPPPTPPAPVIPPPTPPASVIPPPAPPVTTIPIMTPPDTTNPTYTPTTDPSIYGVEPSAMPSSATSISKRSTLLLAVTYFLGSLVANHL